MNNFTVIAIQSFVITTIIVYALLVPVFFEMEIMLLEKNKTLLMIIMIRRHIVNK